MEEVRGQMLAREASITTETVLLLVNEIFPTTRIPTKSFPRISIKYSVV